MTLPTLLLASGSARRAELLERAGWPFLQVTPPFDDGTADLPDLPPCQKACVLALLKAASVAREQPSGLVLGCDTLLICDGRVLGKPRDAAHAGRMLDRLFDRPHKACSAVALIDAASGTTGLFHDIATVRIAHPGPQALDRYLRSGQWQGKAGGYNLAELEDQWHFQVIGDPTTVIGLPMQQLPDQVRALLARLNRPRGSAP